MLHLGVKVHSFGSRNLQEDTQLAEFLKGTEIVASFWLPQCTACRFQAAERTGRGRTIRVHRSVRRDCYAEGDYRLEVELLSEQHPSLNRKIGTSASRSVHPISTSLSCAMDHSPPPRCSHPAMIGPKSRSLPATASSSWPSSQVAPWSIFVVSRLYEPSVWRDDRPRQMLPLERVQ